MRSISGDPELNPETTSMMNLLCAWCIGLLVAIEGAQGNAHGAQLCTAARAETGTLSVPSLLGYVESLGGDKHTYGPLGSESAHLAAFLV